MFSKQFILLLINISLCLSEVSISPNDRIEINEGDPLEITCTATADIDFFYPKNITGLAATSPGSVIGESANGTSKFIFIKSKTLYGDSGWYGCVDASKNQPKPNFRDISVTPDNYDNKDVKWTYVFVKSTEHFFVDIPFLHPDTEGNYYLFGEEGDDVLLPCRPTSADYNVNLYSFGGDMPADSLEYDPRRGMVIKNFQKDSLSHYYCFAVGNDSQVTERRHFEIRIIDHALNIPEITTDRFTLMEIGRSFSMKCTAQLVDSNDVLLDWFVPQTDPMANNKITFSSYLSDDRILNYRLVSSVLTINNITKEDFGEYECRLRRYATLPGAKVKLTPHERRHLEISLQNAKTEYVMERDTPYTWTIDVDAYPLPEIYWLDPQGNRGPGPRIVRGYQINSEKFSIVFTKDQFTVDDLGVHTIFANTSDMQKTISFNVALNTPPKVMELIQRDTCLEKGETIFECRANGYPAPEITWGYWDQNHVFAENGPKFSEVVETHPEHIEVLSVVKVKNCKLGYVSCRVQNKYGEDVMEKPMIIQDPPTSDNSDHIHDPTVDESKKTTVGSGGGLPPAQIGARPVIIKEERPQRTYMVPDEVTFQCRVTGYPEPEITWEYVDDLHTPTKNKPVFIREIVTSSNGNEVVSNATVQIIMPGYVSCVAKNKYGEDSKLEKIILTDPLKEVPASETHPSTPNIEPTNVKNLNKTDNELPPEGTEATISKNPDDQNDASTTEPTKPTVKPDDVDQYSLGTVVLTMNANKGSNITMMCSASIDKFPDDIKWYNTTNLLATDGRVTILKTEAAPLHSSRLTIKDVNKWDERNYTCEGTTKDGTAVKNYYHVHVNASAVFSASVVLQLSIILLSYFM